jgi:hypothetical protein
MVNINSIARNGKRFTAVHGRASAKDEKSRAEKNVRATVVPA